MNFQNKSGQCRADGALNIIPPLTHQEFHPVLAEASVATQILTYKLRLLPSRGQHDKLRDALDHTRDLYNAALEERIDCYRKTGVGRSLYDQCKGLTELRSDPMWSVYGISLQRRPLQQVNLAFSAFFRRTKTRTGKVGFPRFRGRDRFRTFGFSDHWGWVVNNNCLLMEGIGAVRFHLHRPFPSRPTACKIKREGDHWYALLAVEVPCATEHSGASVGIDMGIITMAALSTGELIANSRSSRRAEGEMRRRQRHVARCKRGSNGRRKAKAALGSLHAKIVRIRETHLHQVSADLTGRFRSIAIEKLNIKSLAGSRLAREVHDVAWGRFIGMLRYKAARAGGAVIEVDPRFTSQTCPECGVIKKKELSERTHRCPCGCVLDRDVAAARIILHRAGIGPGRLNVGRWPGRAARKMCLPKLNKGNPHKSPEYEAGKENGQ